MFHRTHKTFIFLNILLVIFEIFIVLKMYGQFLTLNTCIVQRYKLNIITCIKLGSSFVFGLDI